MRRDREGFDYPVANPDLCLKCGLCEKVCPVLNTGDVVLTPVAYAARTESGLENVSSGGMFPLIAEKFIVEGGEVCGAELDLDCKVIHSFVEKIDELPRLVGSKYVQSELYSMFEDVKSELENGCKVLFTGTPCQVAGLKSYLRKDYEGLYCIDVACHGVPSPGLWEKYRAAIEKLHGSKLQHVHFRDKSAGWRHYNIRYIFQEKEVLVPRLKDSFIALFLQDMNLRPSCYECRFRDCESGSDLTLSDLWNVDQAAPQMNDDRGVSGVLVKTKKGQELFTGIAEKLEVYEISMEDLKKDNGGFSGSVQMPEKRAEFFKGVHSTQNLLKYMSGYVVRQPMLKAAYRNVRKFLSGLKRRIVK
jgi:coenzyme F420-reducing hydrogenase beta subunit